jgi:hypothetical protein
MKGGEGTGTVHLQVNFMVVLGMNAAQAALLKQII